MRVGEASPPRVRGPGEEDVQYKFYASGGRYEGQLDAVTSQPHGHGVFYYVCGHRYEGPWEHGEKHGERGTFYCTLGASSKLCRLCCVQSPSLRSPDNFARHFCLAADVRQSQMARDTRVGGAKTSAMASECSFLPYVCSAVPHELGLDCCCAALLNALACQHLTPFAAVVVGCVWDGRRGRAVGARDVL